MKYINSEILLRNRQVFVKARDRAFGEAGRLVDEILALYGENGNESFEAEHLKDIMARLVDRLYHARYYARLSAGGNNVDPPAEIDHEDPPQAVDATDGGSDSEDTGDRPWTRQHPAIDVDQERDVISDVGREVYSYLQR